jgi:hypothetical protein
MDEEDAAGAVPPGGWESPRDGQNSSTDEPLTELIEQLLALVPSELRVRLTDAARQLLEALRALIDWCVAHLERRAGRGGDVEVRDIPIL